MTYIVRRKYKVKTRHNISVTCIVILPGFLYLQIIFACTFYYVLTTSYCVAPLDTNINIGLIFSLSKHTYLQG